MVYYTDLLIIALGLCVIATVDYFIVKLIDRNKQRKLDRTAWVNRKPSVIY